MGKTIRVRVPNNFTVSQATRDAMPVMDPSHTHEMLAADLDGNPYLTAADIPVTDEMIAAARNLGEDGWTKNIIDRYRAMHALAPVPLVSEAEDQRFADRQEILNLRGAVAWRDDRIAELVKATDECVSLGVRQLDEIAMLRQALAAKDARIAELKSVLASTPVAFEDPDAKPPPPPGFLRAIRQGNKATVGLVTGRGDMPGLGDG